MAGRTLRGPLNVEWVNVTYRSVALLALGCLLAASAGGYWFWSRRMMPRSQAERVIASAAERLGEAQGLSLDETLRDVASQAELQLAVARTEFGNRSYGEAKIAAMRSETLSQRVIQGAAGNEEEGRLVTFSKLEGDVRVKQAGGFSWKGADTSMTLHAGDQVKTSSNGSAEVIYFDGTVTRIAPGSLLEIRDLHEDPVTKVRRVREKLTWGEVQASTQKRNVNGSYHEVSTDRVAARSAEAGEFRVAFDQEQRTAVFDVYGGRVELDTANRKANLEAGERIRVDATGDLSAKESLPGVPRLLLPSDQRVFVFEDPGQEQISLTWEELPKINRYRLIISDKPLFTEPLYDAEREGGSAVLDGLTSGVYHWKVAALSRQGVSGPFSPARRFRVSSEQIHDRTDNEPPKLEVNEFVPIGQMVIINGVTDPDARLWIDNNKVDVFEDGSFNAVVKLRAEGANQLLIVAQDPAGNERSLTRKAYVEPY